MSRALAVLAMLLASATLGLAQAAPLPTAHDVIAQAEAKATAQHKSILLSFGASWCGNCHLFDRFLADPTIHPIMDKYYVTTTLITGEHGGDTRHANTPGGPEFEDSVGGKGSGWPYIVLLDATGKPLADSLRPTSSGKSNIGYPDSPAEVDWFMEMLHRSAPGMSAQESATIHSWLTAHGHSS